MPARHDRSREGAAMGEENMAAKSPGHHREGGKASQHACAGRAGQSGEEVRDKLMEC